jgi:hypothetical protein
MKHGKLVVSAALLSVCATLAYASSLRLGVIKGSGGRSDLAPAKQVDKVCLQGAQKQQFVGNVTRGEASLRRGPPGIMFALKQ